MVRTLEEFAALTERGDTALVPTMGAFHEGHLELMRKAKSMANRVVVSLFVNPTQFAAGEDYERYPRDFEADALKAESVGVDVLFAPSIEQMYPRRTLLGRTTKVQVESVTDLWEGASRPGHFDGVATVVLKLFNIVRPTIALFGWKDLQQCLVIQRMVEDLNVPVELRFEPTKREPDGLAMSSRNVYLSIKERESAPMLYSELRSLAKSFARLPGSIDSQLFDSRDALSASGFSIDYLEVVDMDSMRTCREPAVPYAVIVAAKLGNTRLIDNLRSSEIDF